MAIYRKLHIAVLTVKKDVVGESHFTIPTRASAMSRVISTGKKTILLASPSAQV